jgi:hypothetical protein
LIIELYSKDDKVGTNDKIMIAVKKLLQNAHVLNKEDLNRILLEKVPYVAMAINKPYDEELYHLLIELLATWAPNAKLPFPKSKDPIKVHVTEYERMHLMMSLKPVSGLYKAETLELFYLPLY